MSDISFENSLKLYFNGSLIVTAFLITALIDSFSNSRISIELYGLLTNLLYFAISYLLIKIIQHHQKDKSFVQRFLCLKNKDDDMCQYKALLHWSLGIAVYYPLLLTLRKFGISEDYIVYGWGFIIALLQLNFVRKVYRVFTARISPIFNTVTVIALCASTYFLSLTSMGPLNIFFIMKDLLSVAIIAKIFYFRDQSKKVMSMPMKYILASCVFGVIADCTIVHIECVKETIQKSLYIFNGQYDLLLLAQAMMLFFAVFGKQIGNGSDNALIK